MTTTGLTRRGVLAAGGALIVGAAGGYALGTREEQAVGAPAPAPTPDPVPSASASVPGSGSGPGSGSFQFHGPHQPGIATAPALLQTFVGLDLARSSRKDAAAVLRLVTDDAARLMAGEPTLGDGQPELAAHPAGLTITLGLGASLFDRLDLADLRPAQLAPIPSFETDAFEPRWSQTDLLLQVGADDAVTLAHAIRMVLRDLSTLTTVRWLQPGFRPATPATPGTTTTRNLMGQVDGTVNPAPASTAFDETVWIGPGADWITGGTILVLRRIRLLLDTWDILDREVQEQVIGRRLDNGAPLGRTRESDAVPFDEVDDLGLPVIARDAHIRVAHAATARESIFRRPYNYDDGRRDGSVDQGLLFAAYMSDPRVSFIPMQRRIAVSDAFNTWNTTVGSASYLIPSGVEAGRVLAEGMLA